MGEKNMTLSLSKESMDIGFYCPVSHDADLSLTTTPPPNDPVHARMILR